MNIINNRPKKNNIRKDWAGLNLIILNIKNINELRLIPANKDNKIYKFWFFNFRLNKVKKPKPPINKNKKYRPNFKKAKVDLNKKKKAISKAKRNKKLKRLTFLLSNMILEINYNSLYIL